jgi:trk system potassium uptake protein TrkA
MKVIIIGCGRLGSGMARDLSMRGNEVTVIDVDPLAFERLGKGFKIKTVTGIGFDRDVLIKAGIETADSLAAVTSSDEANVVSARLAKMVFHIPESLPAFMIHARPRFTADWVFLPSPRWQLRLPGSQNC